MRLGGAVGAIVVVWLLIGVLAAYQRDYFNRAERVARREPTSR